MGEIGFWILGSITLVASVFAVLFLVGAFLPRSHQVTRSLVLKQSPEAVWQVLTDYANVPTWHQHVHKVERLPDRDGHDFWQETYPGDYILFAETIESLPSTRLVRTFVDDKGPFRGRWEFALAANETGCRLSITEVGDIANPFFRLMFRMNMKPEFYVELYLQALAKKFGESANFV